ncbi:PC3-like endoprotease variant B isoform X2 [Narcine bancroftii]|uniref:PC3-like endoprotease variant B isoform X2 n=1 Tax=Narcine bancroftii TaxID=1343680 RepID=UPI0038313631
MAFGTLVQLSLSLCFLQSALVTTRGREIAELLNYFTIEIDEGEDIARDVAKRNGLEYVLPVGNLKGFHILKLPSERITKRSTKQSTDELLKRLSQDPQVRWAEQQEIHEVEKRDKAVLPDSPLFPEGLGLDSAFESLEQEKKDILSSAIFKVLDSESEKGNVLQFNDPLWPAQWELFNTGQTNGPRGFDINVMPAWKKNITGSGVVVAVIDDGVDYSNTDLKKNYDPNASFNFNGHFDDHHDPRPNSARAYNGHGTKCAGEIAMEANNSFCGVGVAYNAKIGGIRLLDGKVTDALEAAALTYKNNYIDIYICCWGPKDNGRKLEGPRKLTVKALKEGAEKGRNGKGNIFIWASGNGGLFSDHCGADGYVNNIFTVAVGAVSYLGLSTYYTEACAGVMAVIPTGGASESPYYAYKPNETDLVTTALNNKCTKIFKGTSSAAPMAAAIIALVLQVNPNLTWRDLQHLIVRTSKISDIMNKDWKINGAGYHIHHKNFLELIPDCNILQKSGCSSHRNLHIFIRSVFQGWKNPKVTSPKLLQLSTQHYYSSSKQDSKATVVRKEFVDFSSICVGFPPVSSHNPKVYGFGLLDAGRMLKEALQWNTIGPQRQCVNNYIFQQERVIPTNGSLMLRLKTNACQGTENAINTLEHVQVTVNISSVCRGDLSISLTSPYGTTSELLAVRLIDNSKFGLRHWTMMSVHSWGEDPEGEWNLTITDHFMSTVGCGRNVKDLTSGLINKFGLTLWGTYQDIRQEIKDDVRKLRDEDDEELIVLKNLIKELKIDSRLVETFFYENKRKVDEDEIPYTWSDPQLPGDARSTSGPSSNLGKLPLKFWHSLSREEKTKFQSKRSWLGAWPKGLDEALPESERSNILAAEK